MLKRVDEKFFIVEHALAWVCAIIIFAVMILGTVQVIGRVVFSQPIYGYSDIIEQVMTIFAFLAIAYTQKLGGHVRMELLLVNLKGRPLFFLEIIGTIAAIFVIAILAYYSYGHFVRAFDIGDTTIDMDIPIWPSKLLVPIAFAVLIVRLLIQLVGFVRLFMSPDAEMIGVPKIETVEDMAQAEIDAGLAGEEEKVIVRRDGGPA